MVVVLVVVAVAAAVAAAAEALAVLVAQGGKRGSVMGRDRDGAKGEGAARISGLRESSLLLSCTLPERAIHRCHQFPMSALLLACYHGAQAFPPAGAARGRSHQPHSAPAGQGRVVDTSRDTPDRCLTGVLAWTAVCSQLAPERRCD